MAVLGLEDQLGQSRLRLVGVDDPLAFSRHSERNWFRIRGRIPI